MAKLLLGKGIASTTQSPEHTHTAEGIMGGQPSQLGAVGQLYVSQETAEVLKSMYRQSTQALGPILKWLPKAAGLYGGTLRGFRIGKTVFSPATVAVNALSWGAVFLANGRAKHNLKRHIQIGYHPLYYYRLLGIFLAKKCLVRTNYIE